MLNAAAMSAMPLATLSESGSILKVSAHENAPRLPLRIMLKTDLPDAYQQRVMEISPQIHLENNDQAIGEVNVWFGRINPQEFRRATKLDWVQSSSAGVEHYLFPEMVDSQVVLTNAKGCYAPAIAEHTFGLLFSLTRKIGSQTRNMAQGKWQGESDMVEMKDMTMGIIGLGGIGSQVARRARALDMRVLAVDIVPKYREQIGDICDEVRLVQDEGLDWLLPQADVVVCAAPHTKDSEGMLDLKEFNRMKKGAYFYQCISW